jgi:glycosyltransferase involved in cell wall biosynthesis
LVIKETGGETFYKGQCAGEAIAQLQRNPDAPEILYLTSDLAEAEMARLYRACHCLVQPYRGEGFGLPVVEAGASGLPVIVSLGGATDDCVPPGAGYFVDARPTTLRLNEFNVDGWVLEPDARSLAGHMKSVFENEEERRKKAARLSAHVHENLTWEHSARAAQMRLNALAAS